MKKSVSPFAALTCQEKHLKWLEYQSIRLPYAKASVDPEPISPPSREDQQPHATPPHCEQPHPPETPSSSSSPSPQHRSAASQPHPGDYLRPRHRQYDAVIARMKQAEMRTQNYTSVN